MYTTYVARIHFHLRFKVEDAFLLHVVFFKKLAIASEDANLKVFARLSL
jgi:hypothetical protein